MENETKKKHGIYNKWNFDVAKFASKGESRYTLQAILVEPNATVATDGHTLVKVTTPDFSLDSFPEVPGQPTAETVEPVLFPANAALTVSKQIPRKETIPILNSAARLETDNSNVGFVSTDLGQAQPTIARKPKGEFPNYEHLIPNDDGAAITIGIDSRKLAALAKFLGDFADDPSHALKITMYGPDKAIKIEAKRRECNQEAVALLMPLQPPE
jgi:hypothetical protein